MRNKVGDLVFWVPVLLLVGLMLVTPWFGSASGQTGQGPGIAPLGANSTDAGAVVITSHTSVSFSGPGPMPAPTGPPVAAMPQSVTRTQPHGS